MGGARVCYQHIAQILSYRNFMIQDGLVVRDVVLVREVVITWSVSDQTSKSTVLLIWIQINKPPAYALPTDKRYCPPCLLLPPGR